MLARLCSPHYAGNRGHGGHREGGTRSQDRVASRFAAGKHRGRAEELVQMHAETKRHVRSHGSDPGVT